MENNNQPPNIKFFLLILILADILWASTFYMNINKLSKETPPKKENIVFSEIIHGNQSKKQLIFTFDGGSNSVSTEKILETLKKHNVKGTFFLTGKFVENNPDIVKRISAEGNEIFNHTYDHPHLTTSANKEIIFELNKMDKTFEKITGLSTKPYFRPPYGDRDTRVLNTAEQAGFRSVYWTVDALDWEEGIEGGKNADDVKNRILDNVAPGNIYLMHLGDNITGDILDSVFSTLEEQGYKIVSLTQGL